MAGAAYGYVGSRKSLKTSITIQQVEVRGFFKGVKKHSLGISVSRNGNASSSGTIVETGRSKSGRG